MTTSLTPQAPTRRIGGGPTRSVAASSWTALGALMLRDLVVVRNHWTGTEAASGTRYEFAGIVIWRIAHRQFVERWEPHAAAASQNVSRERVSPFSPWQACRLKEF